MTPSPSQALALNINYHKNMLISAGAGSGKTAVLSERIKDIILSGVDPTNLLVLTFTKDAAAEMKARVKSLLIKNNLLDKLPSLEQAYFTTFDAYSLSLCKKYSYLFGIGQDIGIADDTAIYGTKVKILNDIFNEYLEKDDKTFKSYLKFYTSKSLDEAVYKVLSFIDSLDLLPDTIGYLNNLDNTELSDSYNKKIKELYQNYINELVEKLLVATSKIRDNMTDLNQVAYLDNILKSHVESIDYELLISQFNSFELPRRNKKAEKISEEESKLIDAYKKKIKSFNEQFKLKNNIDEDINLTKKYISLIRDIILEYYKRLDSFKKKMNIYEYVDIAKMVISLVRTNESVRKSLMNQYHEILIDEYQDTSDLQEAFIKEIANNNLFMVGDIKQSIYRFRHANPKNFKEKYDSYQKLYASTDCDNYQELNDSIDYENVKGLRVDMKENFRSRKEVLEDIRTIFNPLMTPSFGDANFERDHQMIYGNKYLYNEDEKNRDYHMKLISYDYKDPRANKFKKEEIEAYIVAYDIKKRLENRQQVMDKELKKFRDITPSDFCIICDRGNYFYTLEAILQHMGIPVSINKDEDINSSDTIFAILSLIKLVSKSYSSNEELLSKDKSYWHAVASIYRSFIKKDEFSDTDIFQIVAKRDFKNPVSELGFEIAKDIDNYSNGDIYLNILDKFKIYQKLNRTTEINKSMHEIEYIYNNINNLSNLGYHFTEIDTYLTETLDAGLKLKYSLDRSDDPGVKIMNIHKSKGLEFSVCYFLDYDHKPNETNYKNEFGFSEELGIFIPSFVDEDNMFEKEAGLRTTCQSVLFNYYGKKENYSERVRLFYVALTRAREEFVLIYPKDKANPDSLIHDELKSFNNYLTYIKQKTSLNETTIDFSTFKIDPNYRNNSSTINLKSNSKYKYQNLNIVSNIEEKSRISKSITKLMDNHKLDNLELGTLAHEAMESLDFKNIDLNNLKVSDNIKDLVKSALENDLFKDVSKAKAFKELEFKFELDGKSYNGIIDLLLVYEDKVKIIDYKLSNVDSPEYIRQLSIYKKFVETKTKLPIECYLYSLAGKLAKKVECVDNI